ncbi:MAG: 50S ribosome-binding GTPase [Magnetococcales bacterium]|nr:50S ribosome-binding GTPase [Magnetococcales bacterium]
MRFSSAVRLSMVLLLLLLLLLLLALFIQFSNALLDLWERLRTAPEWFFFLYWGILASVAVIGVVWVWRVVAASAFRPRQSYLSDHKNGLANVPIDERMVAERIDRNQRLGASTAVARQELDLLQQRRDSGDVHIALFGEVNAGKSTLMCALLPNANTAISPVAGTTREMVQRVWVDTAGHRFILTDLPGCNEVYDHLAEGAREEALRAHLVVYLCDGDLTRVQIQELQQLAMLGKPLLVGLNKMDRYSDEELLLLLQRIRERIAAVNSKHPIELVSLSAGGWQEVIRVHADGREEPIQRPLPPQLEQFYAAVRRIIKDDAPVLEALRDQAVLTLAARKLDQSLSQHRRQKADSIVLSYTRKAVVGALAALTPGMDLLIQGVLAVSMVKELCSLYEVKVSRVEIDRLLRQSDRLKGRSLPLVLAVAGNLLKSFPGAGTMAGGVLHAVAYGLLFDSLGRALIGTLEERGALLINPTLHRFETSLADDLDGRLQRLLKLALGQSSERRSDA